jgi:hypothetical protein
MSSAWALRSAAFSIRAAATVGSVVSFANLRSVAIWRAAYKTLDTWTSPRSIHLPRPNDVALRESFREVYKNVQSGLALLKTGHSQIQIRPEGVKTGQHLLANKNIS